MGLTTLESRRERGDLINVYRMMHGMDKTGEDLLKRDTRITRGHGKKLKKERCVRDIKKYSFPHRVITVWHGLDEHTVNASSVHCFKARLDRVRYQGGTQ